MRIVVTGAEGFIASNLLVKLGELGHTNVVGIGRDTSHADRHQALTSTDFVFHLAGVNRPRETAEFVSGNVGSTEMLCAALAAAGRRATVVFSSSTQATLDNAYGQSKRTAEETLLRHARETGSTVHVFRLVNVFGKWCRPDYNSVVATFCHNLARGLPIRVDDPAAPLRLVYVEDVVAAFTALLAGPQAGNGYAEAGPVYETTVGELAQTLRAFGTSRSTLLTDRVGVGMIRALYATYISYLPPTYFGYEVPRYEDSRGLFVEMLKTPDCGQFSYFSARPGVTRGEHYHHSKTEKFLVVRGTARFGFRQIRTGETHELIARGGEASIVETVPGWAHNITNIGDDDLIVMLWANEIFDRSQPDTQPMKVKP